MLVHDFIRNCFTNVAMVEGRSLLGLFKNITGPLLLLKIVL